MARKEFTRKTKQEALKRADIKCEATGTRYGFAEGQRCNCSLSLGVQYDHAVPDALGGDNSLKNCLAICVQCHKFKTRNDVKQIAKSNRQRDKASGVIRPAGKIKSPGFAKSEKPKKSVIFRPVTFYREDTP
ncbi:HNH endonuclease [Rhizobium sp. Leaf311]|uniref:HNH endonuclease n=1 Tax=Rhizobium sp. Leaf311 TaxID=1736332 RepID=UPI000713F099|nr:HNH endonuclease [Rhizobium sp. Leaf311]KQQ46476.1 HNH endonuclease [Rhizobium sp. Leaf311]